MKTDASLCSVRDVEDAVPYIKTIYETSRRPSPTSKRFTGRRGRRPLHLFNRINFQNYKALLIDNSRDVCTSQARCATQGRRHRQNVICFMFRKSYNNFRDVEDAVPYTFSIEVISKL